MAKGICRAVLNSDLIQSILDGFVQTMPLWIKWCYFIILIVVIFVTLCTQLGTIICPSQSITGTFLFSVFAPVNLQ